jgi:hypothetical protein
MVDGIRFHSAREAQRYGELKLLENIGRIRRLRLQHPWPLIVTDNEGERHMIGCYRSDFDFEELNPRAYLGWRWVIEDVKGFATPLYKLKKKIVEAQYGIVVKEIR